MGSLQLLLWMSFHLTLVVSFIALVNGSPTHKKKKKKKKLPAPRATDVVAAVVVAAAAAHGAVAAAVTNAAGHGVKVPSRQAVHHALLSGAVPCRKDWLAWKLPTWIPWHAKPEWGSHLTQAGVASGGDMSVPGEPWAKVINALKSCSEVLITEQ